MDLWERDTVQFPRLLAEIMATVDLTDDMLRPVAESMDLELSDVLELFNRAQVAWEQSKAIYVPVEVPEIDEDTVVADLTRISRWLAEQTDNDEAQGAASDLLNAATWIVHS